MAWKDQATVLRSAALRHVSGALTPCFVFSLHCLRLWVNGGAELHSEAAWIVNDLKRCHMRRVLTELNLATWWQSQHTETHTHYRWFLSVSETLSSLSLKPMISENIFQYFYTDFRFHFYANVIYSSISGYRYRATQIV